MIMFDFVILIFHTRVTWLYTQTLGSLFAASYDSLGYGGGIPTSLHEVLS
jgi:hypothetical protein